jgi:hypothetical protein
MNPDPESSPPPSPSPGEEARRAVLCEFADDVRRRLEADTTPAGQLLSSHTGRQLDLVGSERYTHWFREVGRRHGFDQETTLAAIAGSDVTKVSIFSETARSHFGTTAGRVAALAAQDDLRYGRAFAAYTPLENLYMHAEAGRHYTRNELARRGAPVLDPCEAERMAREASEGVLGHDSFNAGFGRHKLKPLLAARYQEPPEAFGYPTSRTPVGFLVQVLDRIEGCDPETMLRYVTEEVVQRKAPIAQAIRVGLIENFDFLLEVYDRIVPDSLATLPPDQAGVFRESPAMQDFVRGLRRACKIVSLLGEPPSTGDDGFYHLKHGAGWVLLDSLEVFRHHFLMAAGAVT